MITTGYDLPFTVAVAGLGHGSVQRARLRMRIDDFGEADRITHCVDRFARLAATGALGGDGVTPWETEFTAVAGTSLSPGSLEYEVSCRLPAQAWVVLAHLLARQAPQAGLREMAVRGFDHPTEVGIARSPKGFSTYPRAYKPRSFALDDQNPEGGTYNFYVRLQAPVDERNEATLNDWLAAWTDAVHSGGYALAPIDSASDYVEPHSSSVDTYDSVIEWTVYKLRADPVAAIDAVINIFASFDVRCQRIQSLEIG